MGGVRQHWQTTDHLDVGNGRVVLGPTLDRKASEDEVFGEEVLPSVGERLDGNGSLEENATVILSQSHQQMGSVEALDIDCKGEALSQPHGRCSHRQAHSRCLSMLGFVAVGDEREAHEGVGARDESGHTTVADDAYVEDDCTVGLPVV